MQKKRIFAMLLSAMIVMSASAVSVSAACDPGTCVGGTATCTEPAVCDNCGEPHGEPLGHTELVEEEAAVQATCTETGKTAVMGCSRCDYTEGGETIPATGHTELVEKEAAVQATCTETGKTAVMGCSRCDYTEGGETIPATGHTEVPIQEAVTATCTTDGSTAGVKCSVCDEVITAIETIPATGHSFGYTKNSDDSTHAKNCSKCDSEDIANETCTDKGDGTCVCGRTMASQEEPGEEKTAITEVNLRMGGFEVGGTLPTVGAEEANVNYTIDHKWFKNGKEVSDLATIEADKYTCQITLTAKEGYTFKGLTIATFPGFTKQPTQPLTVSEDGSEATTSVTIDKSDKKEESGSGSTGGSSSSSTTNPSVNADAEADKIKGAEAGQKVEVKIDGNTVPAAYVQAALSSKATIVVDYGAYAWEISDVKQVKAVDLSINTSARYLVEQGALKGLKGDNSNVIDIAHDGNLGFKGTLKYNVRKANAGKYVNLYFYNTKTKKLELQGSTKIGSDGYVLLPFTHCSTYVLNITATPASNELFEDFSAGESATVVEDTLPAATNAPAATEAPATTDAAANPETGNSAAALMAIPMAIAAAAIISKKR